MKTPNTTAIHKLTTHLNTIYALCETLNGEYGPTCGPLLKHYGEAFNYISVKLLPQMGMTNDEIANLVMAIGDENPDLMGQLADHFHKLD
jgi:hypothetical protein